MGKDKGSFLLEKFRTFYFQQKTCQVIYCFCNTKATRFDSIGGVKMKRAFIALTMLVVLTSATILQAATLSAVQTQQTNPNNLIVTGTTAAGGVFSGVLDITRFAVQNGQLVAVGQLTGTLTDVAGVVTNISRIIALPVLVGNATCEILDLQLGPLDLNLLGLVIHLDQINLQITAQSGPGNLLGNLLCAVANLLNGGGPLTSLAGLLNQILRILG